MENALFIPSHWRQVRLVTITPPGYPHSQAFAELLEFTRGGLQELGIQVDCSVNSLSNQGINLIFGAHMFNLEQISVLPDNIVLYNLEQLGGRVLEAAPHYERLLSRFPVWDYSRRNIDRCRARTRNPRIHHVGVGYCAGTNQIAASPSQPIDVLFYGCVNERRKVVLEGLRQAGMEVQQLFNVYGAERDAAIAKAKVVLNLHFYADSIHEIARTSYLLANRKAVVTECNEGTEIDDDLRQAMKAVPYDQLVEACIALVRDDSGRRQLENQGFEVFSRRNQADMLARSIAETSPPLPRIINLGSGKSWSPDCLNIDINPVWRPDLLADISNPQWLDRPFVSARFGTQRLSVGWFDEIIARDVLEQVPALPQLMTQCLALLREGGRMSISVPYDLSYGAWQDPTHIRAFNERSWLYYTDWHWYLGWTEARFDLHSLQMALSPLGKALQKTMPSDQVFCQPRAVDSMEVTLVKRRLTEQERLTALQSHSGAHRSSARRH